MKKQLYKFAAIAAAALLLCSAGCEKKKEAESSAPTTAAATKDEPTKEPYEQPDIGEHKDYDKEEAKYYESGTILIADQDGTKRGMEEFSMELNVGCLEFYANELNTVKELAGDKVNVYSMIVPTASELYCPSNARDLVDDQEKIIKDVKDMFMCVKQVDVLPTLKNHNAENIYFRTDTRWTPLGAYYASRVFANVAGVPFDDLSEYTAESAVAYRGDLLNMCGPEGYNELDKAPDSFVYYTPKNAFTTNYYDDQFEFLTTDIFFEPIKERMYDSYYKGGFYSLRLDTKASNSRKLMIIKDDFGTAVPSFLTGSFSQIYVVSYDYLGANIMEMIDEFGITDVLYLTSTYTVTDSRVYTLETLRTQATHGSLEDAAPVAADPDKVKVEKKNTDTDPFADSDTENNGDQVEYIYDVGINNQIGIVESSDEDNGSTGYEENENNTYDDDPADGEAEYYGGEDENDYSYDYEY